jgi:hypothetical protein
MSVPKKYQLSAGTYTQAIPFVGEGQVLWPTNGLDLSGCSIVIDNVGNPPLEWPAGLLSLDLGQPFQQFWIIGNVTNGGDLIVADCGFRPGLGLLNPAPVELNPIAGTPVVETANNRGPAVVIAAEDPNDNPQSVRCSTDGAIVVGTYDGGGLTNNLMSPQGAASGANPAGGLAVGGWGSWSSVQYNVAVPAAGGVNLQLPSGVQGQWRRAFIWLDLSAGGGYLKLQAAVYNVYSGTVWVDVMAGASGAGLPAGQYLYATDGLTVKELTGQTPAVLLPAAMIMSNSKTAAFRVFNTDTGAAQTLTSEAVGVDNF